MPTLGRSKATQGDGGRVLAVDCGNACVGGFGNNACGGLVKIFVFAWSGMHE
jgi:hypothetical protein